MKRLSRAAELTVALAAAATVALLLAGAARLPGGPMEEGKLLVAADLLSNGTIPHRDYEHFYGPGDVWAVAGAFAAFGTSQVAARAVGLLALATLVVAVAVVAKRAAGTVAASAAAVTVAAIVAPFGAAPYSWFLALASATASLAFAASRRFMFVAGLCAGSAVLFRLDIAPAVVAAAFVLLAGEVRGARLRWAGGAATGLAPYLIHAALVGPTVLIDRMVIDPVVRLRGGRSLPVPPPIDTPAAALERFATAGVDVFPWPELRPGAQLNLTFWIVVVAGISGLGIALVHFVLDRHQTSHHQVAIAVYAIALLPQLVQRADMTHVRFVAPIVVGLMPVAVARRSVVVTSLTLVGLAGLVLSAPATMAVGIRDTVSVALGEDVAVARHGGRSFLVQSREQRDEVERVVREVARTAPRGSSLVVAPNDLRRTNYSDASLYWLLPQYEPATYHLEMNPGMANGPRSRLAGDIRRADVVVLDARFDGWDEPNASREVGSDAAERVVQTSFCPRRSVGRFRILVPCGGGDRGAPRPSLAELPRR